jgi:hypothetical protein
VKQCFKVGAASFWWGWNRSRNTMLLRLCGSD